MNGSSLTLGLAGLLGAAALRRGARAMKTPSDLPPSLVLSVLESGDRSGTIFLNLGKKNAYWWEGPGGRLVLERTAWNLWEVTSMEAEHGYGPLLYDLAMELAWLNGVDGLLPDRSAVSLDAEEVWLRYAESRPDVKRAPVPEGYPGRDKYTLWHRDFLDGVYSKDGAPFLREMVARGNVEGISRSPLLKGLSLSSMKSLKTQGSRAMKTPEDLGPSWKVKISKLGEDYRIELYPPQGKAAGTLTLGGSRGLWSVHGASAEQGYGPLLYDLALECVGLLGGRGLHSDAFVSAEASEVWRRYHATRPGVEARLLPDELRYLDRDDPRRPWLSKSYLKKGVPFLKQLLQRKQLRVSLPKGDPLRTGLKGLETEHA